MAFNLGLAKYHPITKAEELELFSKYQVTKDENIRQEIINRNLRFVMQLAKKYAKNSELVMDNFNEGYLGISKAFDRYIPNKDCRFISYAVDWIKRYIFQSFSNYDVVHMSTSTRKADLKNITSCNIDAKNDNDVDIFQIEQTLYESQELTTLKKESLKILDELLLDLDNREQSILIMRDGHQMTYDEIALNCKSSRENIRQLHNKSLRKIQRQCVTKSLMNHREIMDF